MDITISRRSAIFHPLSLFHIIVLRFLFLLILSLRQPRLTTLLYSALGPRGRIQIGRIDCSNLDQAGRAETTRNALFHLIQRFSSMKPPLSLKPLHLPLFRARMVVSRAAHSFEKQINQDFAKGGEDNKGASFSFLFVFPF